MNIRSGAFIRLHTFDLRKAQCLLLPETKAYPTNFVPIKALKIADLRNLYAYIPSQHIQFYDELLAWETTEAQDDDVEQEPES